MNLLKEYIQFVLREMEITHDGAGIVVVRSFDDGWRVLGLVDSEGMDIPKGHVETGEEPLITAFRETEEESTIGESDLYFRWGLEPIIIDGHLVIYLAETSKDPAIPPNPLTGDYEHDGAWWLPFDDMVEQSLDFLQPAIIWAKNKVLT